MTVSVGSCSYSAVYQLLDFSGPCAGFQMGGSARAAGMIYSLRPRFLRFVIPVLDSIFAALMAHFGGMLRARVVAERVSRRILAQSYSCLRGCREVSKAFVGKSL